MRRSNRRSSSLRRSGSSSGQAQQGRGMDWQDSSQFSLGRPPRGIDHSQMSCYDNEPNTVAGRRTSEQTTKQGQRNYRRSQLILAALCLVAIGLVLTTYFLLRSGEEIEFETSFHIYARETAVVADLRAENVFGQLQSLASAVRSSSAGGASYNNNISAIIPDFDLRAEEIANLTGIELIMFVPFVPKEQQEEWEDYQFRNQEWIEEGYHYRGWNTSNLQPIPQRIHNYTLPAGYNDTRRGFVNLDTSFMEDILSNHTTVNTTTGYSVPVAQIGPALVDTSIVMTDLFTHPIVKKEIIASLEYDVPVISEPEDLEFLLKSVRQPMMSSSENSWSSTTSIDYTSPRSFTLDPVKAGYGKDSLTIGYIVGVIQWSSFFQNFLPQDINGIIVNVESDCGKNFTYVVNGGRQDEWYLDPSGSDGAGAGPGPAGSNNKYQYLEQRFKFFWKDHPKGTSRHCHFDLLITPSDEFAEAYNTDAPLKWAGIVFAVCFVVAIGFFVYDNYNRKQQELIALEKEQAEAVVTSLFPKQIGEQLMEEQGPKRNLRSSSNNNHHNADEQGGRVTLDLGPLNWGSLNVPILPLPLLPSLPLLPGLGGSSSNLLDDSDDEEEEKEERAVPLAELYPSASIMFADLKGFTAWSSDRPPSDVFKLLESIYGEMDQLAKICKVFKIETIGDCYVAVCGLPQKRKNHAVLLAWFAKQCLDRFNKLVLILEKDLPGTSVLQLRTGLHSGPVTAGVLRGERARFQLFGDTVNTTARIETTGEGGKIHLSEQFAEELTKFDKGHWAVPRPDKVEAKGKGTLSTFWLELSPGQEKKPGSCHSSVLLSINEGEGSDTSSQEEDGEEFTQDSCMFSSGEGVGEAGIVGSSEATMHNNSSIDGSLEKFCNYGQAPSPNADVCRTLDTDDLSV